MKEKVSVTDNKITVDGESFTFNKPILIAVGKASIPMSKFFVERIHFVDKLIVVPKNAKADNYVIRAGHPLPDENSIKAGEKAIELLNSNDYDLVIFAISGGASAMIETSELSLEELIYINKTLISSGLGINSINIVRKHLSKIKGGKIINYVKNNATVLSFIVSDVPGNDVSSIGSGLTAVDHSTLNDAINILKKLNLHKYINYLTETPKEFKHVVKNFVILDNMSVLKRLSTDLANSLILTSEIRGEAKDVGSFLASIYNSIDSYSLPLKRSSYIILGGEPEVTITGKAGKGGRNGEVCLSFLKYVRKNNSKFELLAFATDGIDGNSEYAGCIVSQDIKLDESEIDKALETHSSYEILEKYNAVIKTGYTNTNVNNIYVLNAP
ncbi:glycerate kinase [Sulfolobus sp. A20]|nr:glycerate kinase [Sulfolobus sp. A20]